MKRGYGVLMPIFSLPSPHGIGDFGRDAFQFADLCADHGAGYWQVLPLNAGNPENGESPYFSTSGFAINPLLISLERLADIGLLAKNEIAREIGSSRGEISYGEVRSLKLPLIFLAASRFEGGPSFDEFCRMHGCWLDDFTLFDALRATINTPWNKWPSGYRDRVPRSIGEFAEGNGDAIHIRKVIQYFAFSQWEELRRHCSRRNVTIIGDMPIYVALDSADTWSYPNLFKLDERKEPLAVSGVPPDYFSETGQLWGNPVYNWEVHEKKNFSWWICRMRHLFSLYDIVRIDHFRGLVQYWEIPADESSAINGEWVDVPTYAFFDTLMSELKPFPVICEDLGIITDDVREAMKRYRFPGMKVLQFAFGEDDPSHPYLPHNYEDDCIVYTGTHDNPPTLEWLKSECADAIKQRIAHYTGKQSGDEETVWDLIELAMDSLARTAIFPLQDILGMAHGGRINNPGIMDGNWRWRWDKERHPSCDAFRKMLALAKKSNRV